MEEDPEEEPEEEMEEDPEEDPEEEMEVDNNPVVSIISNSKSDATSPATPVRSFTNTPEKRPRKTARIVGWESNKVKKWINKWNAGRNFEKGQSSRATPTDMDVENLTHLFEQNACLNVKIWHISDELSAMQGQSEQVKARMRTSLCRQEEALEQDHVYQLINQELHVPEEPK
ncbi:hypothetical protein L1887_42596 [Cichorium endivia]|nr:hypothetical protein L1887_42596 [Cichorium endivia]